MSISTNNCLGTGLFLYKIRSSTTLSSKRFLLSTEPFILAFLLVDAITDVIFRNHKINFEVYDEIKHYLRTID